MTQKIQKNNNYKVIFAIFIVFCMSFFAVSCKKKQAPAVSPQVVDALALQPKTVILKQVSSVKPPSTTANQLDFSAKKDPFKPYVSVNALASADLSKQKRETRILLPIHSFDVSQFKLIGVVADAKGNKAMVVDPAGKGYVLKLGMTIGKNEGKITRIETSGVDVVEQFQDDNNKVRKETIRITLLRKP